MTSFRRSAFVDFLLLEPDPGPDVWDGLQPSSSKSQFWKANTSFTQNAQSGFDSFLDTKGYVGHEIQAPSMVSALLFGTGLAAVGAGAYFFTRPPPAEATGATGATGAQAEAAAAAAADPPAAISAETSERLERRTQLLSELESLEPGDRREELLQQIQQLDQELEASNPDILAGRTLRQFLAADAAQRANASTESFLQLLYNRIAPAFTRMEQMKRVLEVRVQNVSTRVPQIISEEVEAATEETRNLLQIPLPDARLNISEHLPSLTMLLAGLMAPLQLKVMYADNLARLGISGAILSMDVIALLTAHGTRCISQQLPLLGTLDALHVWIGVDAISLGFACAVSAMVLQKCGQTIAEVDASMELPEANPSDPEEAFRAALEKQLLAGSKAIIMYDSLSGSTVLRLLPVLSLFDFVWQANGLMLLFDTPGSSCGAHFLLDWSRGRGVIFLIGLVPMLTTVGLAAVRVAVSSSSFGQSLLEAAANLDEASFPHGPPVFTILVRSFVVRDVTDMAKIRLQVAKAEETKLTSARDNIQAEKDAVEAKLAAKEAELQTTSEQIRVQQEALAQDPREAEFLRQYREAVAQAMALQSGSLDAVVSSALAAVELPETSVPPEMAGLGFASSEAAASDGDQGGTGGAAS